MIPIESIPAPLTPEDRARKQRDRLVLTAEERRWPRGRFRTESGRELAFALPSGAQFEPGQTVGAGEDWFVAIEAAEEPVLAVSPASRREAVRIAFEVGNRHFPLAIDGERVAGSRRSGDDATFRPAGRDMAARDKGVRADRQDAPA